MKKRASQERRICGLTCPSCRCGHISPNRLCGHTGPKRVCGHTCPKRVCGHTGPKTRMRSHLERNTSTTDAKAYQKDKLRMPKRTKKAVCVRLLMSMVYVGVFVSMSLGFCLLTRVLLCVHLFGRILSHNFAVLFGVTKNIRGRTTCN